MLFEHLNRVTAPYSCTFQNKEMRLYSDLILQCMEDFIQAWKEYLDWCNSPTDSDTATTVAEASEDLTYRQLCCLLAIFIVPGMLHMLHATAPSRSCFFEEASLEDRSTRTKLTKYLVQLCKTYTKRIGDYTPLQKTPYITLAWVRSFYT